MSIKNKSIIVNLFIAVICFYFIPVCFSESNFIGAKLVCDDTCVKAGKSFKVKTFIESDSNLSVIAFRFTLKYDSSKFIYNNFTAPRGTSRRNFNIKAEDNLLHIEYMCKKSNLLVNTNFNVCNFIFDSRANVDSCTCEFEFLDFEIIDGYGRNLYLTNLNNLTVNLEGEVKPNCYLSKLVPSSGELVPDFNKNIFEYDIYASYDTDFIDFDICCENEFANSSVNKRKLAPAGKDTKINITVNDKKAKLKRTYIINVHRCDKPCLEEKTAKDTPLDNSSEKVRKRSKKSKSETLNNKPQPCKTPSQDDESRIDDDNENINVSDDNYVLLDDNKSSEDFKSHFDERLIIGTFVILVLGGLFIYKIIDKNK